MPQYSASMVSHSFWFNEFSQYLELKEQGNNDDDIRYLAIEENLFQQQSTARALRMVQTLKRRVNVLDEDYFDLFSSLDLTNRKIINLSASLQLDPLFDEFLYEVYRNELILGDAKLYSYEVEAFFSQKQIENPKVASWTEQTTRRLASTFKAFLREAGLLEDQGDYDQVKRPLLDTRLEILLHTKGLTRQLAAFLGR
ncbi:hypothetical protein FC99_GL001756 [Levilactobacillus koreensis JCM 16448]|uniref:DUF1819 family protein n=1 Tax=Levilactobacillus koreensis TaxID=637971 RepID=A0AAC8UVE7_9LACO|nr:DUF1819 family protein [Levilactobacillus koreensis]AKP64721.1 hypothetical protein ABN16_06740 [Levilactobacillus koreensis]KRK86236.1 hypothetical protein FC99_GL001756 [Levilactobacillus koreensis JCM 16448]